MSRSRLLLVVLFFAALLSPVAPAQAASTLLCSGYANCERAGYSHGGYEAKQKYSYWRMYTGTNCTNYVAYRLVTTNGMANTRPKSGVGNARDWGVAMASVTDKTPTVGSVAWWGKASGGNHVAYVERVVSSTEIVVSESNWGRSFDWRRITKSGSGWPDGFIHFADPKLTNTVKPKVSGTPRVGEKLTAKVGSWTPEPIRYRYAWRADGETIPGAKDSTFTPTADQLGAEISVKVAAVRDGHPVGVAYSAATAPVAAADAVEPNAPRVEGTPQVDQTLTADVDVPAKSTVRHRWLADGKAITDAESERLTLSPDEVGRRISVRVTVERSGYADWTGTSDPTPAVAKGTLSARTAPSVDGAARVGGRLTADPGTWSVPDVSPAYTWLRDGTPVPGATESSYVPTADDLDARLSVRVAVSRAGYDTATVTTPAMTVGTGELDPSRSPAVQGQPRVGAPVEADAGAWPGDPALSYRWQVDGVDIPGATQRTFVPTAAHLGKKLVLEVLARRDGYQTTLAWSRPSEPVAPGTLTASATPRITGAARVGSTLTVSPGTVTAAATRSIRWLRDGVAIPGATRTTYRAVRADVGRRLVAEVTDTAPGYATLRRTATAASTVRSTAKVVVSPTPGSRRVKVSVRVDAADATPTGKVTVSVGGKKKTATLSGRRAKVTITGLKKGKQKVTVTYAGSTSVESATKSKNVTVKK